jgi:hypothetical protein
VSSREATAKNNGAASEGVAVVRDANDAVAVGTEVSAEAQKLRNSRDFHAEHARSASY